MKTAVAADEPPDRQPVSGLVSVPTASNTTGTTMMWPPTFSWLTPSTTAAVGPTFVLVLR